MAHAYNLSYLGGRDQEDCGSRTTQAKKFMRLSSHQKKLGWAW
jgi:hypothetical protein